jgi:hypothetical protein
MRLCRWPLGSKVIMNGDYLKLVPPLALLLGFHKYPKQKKCRDCDTWSSRWSPMIFFQVSGMVHVRQRPSLPLSKTLCDLIFASCQRLSAIHHHHQPHVQCIGTRLSKPCLLRRWSVWGQDRRRLYCASDISCTRLSTTCHTPSTFTKKSISGLHITIPNIPNFWDREVCI